MRIVALMALAALAGCSTSREDFLREPAMSPVGTGLYEYPALAGAPAAFPASGPQTPHSLWSDKQAQFYQDPRALDVGDIVTVKIRIRDQASLDNNSERSRRSGIGSGLDLAGQLGNYELPTVGVELDADGSSNMTGKGKIKRSEDIDLSVAAVVTQKLPNGNLVVSGQQEVRVNFEVRVLAMAGIIRPRDILQNNTIDYDKIAEARISYGGRGRMTEVQQPAWGQQVYDVIAPF
ncbi:MAG: flagellar basal body L-ring protein FlgH [Aurantimonas endophytica]|jgi:flagellar L-ring protein precursor FlgH|uniref:flagellar basal body L-ring protein FlgH n=1 Tax=Aurantimonas endophytica TaxID=1522175 RepID=UPI003003139A